ncbi:MAG: prepilin-type N-terminal cleavage/methylation domain-containing protein, partial [Planctomycetota bacterium]
MKSSRPRARRGFTLIELLIAGLVTAFVLSSISMTLANLGRSKSVSNHRLAAHLRADAALNAIRRDIASIVRTDDLFYTRFLLMHGETRVAGEMVERDELVMFCNRFRPLRDIDFHGEGLEYETQYRIEEDEFGPVLWLRRDALPDKYPLGGGVAAPVAEGIVSLRIEAFDGEQWNEEWESDEQGLPIAVRVTVIARGHAPADDFEHTPLATIRTVIPIDRILLPKD